MFEIVHGRTDDGVTGILLAHPKAFGSGELKIKCLSVCLHVCTYACMLTYGHMFGPQGFRGSGEKGYLFSGSWEHW